MTPLILDGGLDLTTAKPLVQPGTLSDCLNYERGIQQGYGRIEGIEKFDGRSEVSSFKFWRLKSTSVTGTLTAGMAVYFTAGQVGYVLDTATASGVTTIYTVFHAAASDQTAFPATLTGTGGASASILSREILDAPRGTQATLNTALAALATTQRAVIATIQGRDGTDIIHLFWLKNRLYGIRDLCRVYFSGGFYTDANEGQYLTIGASEYEILAVTLTGDNSGFMTLDCVAGSGTDATPIGSPTAIEITFTGDLGDGVIGTAYSDSVTASGGVSPYTYSIVDEPGASVGPVTAIDPNTFVALSATTDAALWRSSTSGWTRIDLGREMQFSAGTSAIANFIRDAELDGATLRDTGFVFPTTSTFNAGATTAPNADDGVTTALTGATGDYFICKGFSFTSIPSTAIIRGIEVVIERQSNTANAAKDQTVGLLGLTAGSENKAKAGSWPNTIGTTTYGGSTDLWGVGSVLVADVQASTFGVQLIVKRASAGTATIGVLDYVKVKVHYVERDTPAYVWNGTTDVSITVRHIQILGGDTGASSAYGYMSITASQNADKNRLIDVGDSIRTAASGGGSLIATVAARDVPIHFPGQENIDSNAARYQTHVTNFYSQDNYEAAFTVCGTGPCIYYDGSRAMRIRTTLPAQEDNPRHVTRHGESLMLGYYSGLAVFSKVGNPLEMRADQGAWTREVGDRLTGLIPISGDATAILCEANIYALRGFTSSTAIKSTITSKRGAIEYLSADIGRVLACDGQGLFAIDAVENFGAASRSYLSTKITPWLRPRLQGIHNSEQAYFRGLTALSVRSKNQVRLYFFDGYVLTFTNEGEGQFTWQRYYDPSGNEDTADIAWPIRAVCSGVDATGRERIFASFYGGVKEGYVYELDHGRTFDADAIPAYVTLNPIDGQSPALNKRADRLFLFGTGHGVATLDVSRGRNYLPPDSTVNLTMTMGATDNDATVTQVPLRGGVDLPIEGYDIAWRIDSSTATEGPHVLQYANVFIDSRGDSRGHVRDN